ncbi:hypothetical protein RDWZM_006771 [Blomia tropicalis]|uniref:UBC core domain-containing protein n=1 Tax=Blomia tropicalis TaxID=40697 RepID=A0A9Q0RNN5_BLOTA|nr:hypothetical protein BLOT_012653 [Blomia tropicalis]KAJ6220959.1 hypothetical protein RDWZM_006771 [Blomia tropicalis]
MDPRSNVQSKPIHHLHHHHQHLEHRSSQSHHQMAFPMPSETTQSLPPSVQCSPIFVEYQLMKEFVLFQKQNLSHVYLIPSYGSAFDWFGIMFIHGGLYAGKCLRFTVHISPSYPNCDVPRIVFDPIPTHPLVDVNNGELDTSFLYPKWNSTNNFIFEIIAQAKHMFEINEIFDLRKFVHIDRKLGFNSTEQLRLTIAKEMANFNDKVIQKEGHDKHFIRFDEPDNPSIIDKLRDKLINGKISTTNGNEFILDNHRSNPYAGGNGYGSPSISGLSWTKKIMFK